MATKTNLQDRLRYQGVQTHCTVVAAVRELVSDDMQVMHVADLDACLCPDELHGLRLVINQHQALNGVLYDEGILNHMPCLCWKAQHLSIHPTLRDKQLAWAVTPHSHTLCILGCKW